jgi:uncharacterized membrane protein YraQ (UPF0718 family)
LKLQLKNGDEKMNTLLETVKYFIFITAELTVLFLGISTLVALMLMYVPREKIKVYMSGKGILGNFVGRIDRIINAILRMFHLPLTLGFLEIGVPSELSCHL